MAVKSGTPYHDKVKVSGEGTSPESELPKKDRAQDPIQDLGEEQEYDFSPKMRDITPRERLQFAKWVLTGIFLFFMVSIFVWLKNQACGQILLEICRTGLLPIASFVIGDYFGSRGR